jgi:septum formation protein
MSTRLILASASPRRCELLSLLRVPFDVVPSTVDEDLGGLGPVALAETLARDKAHQVWTCESQSGGVAVLGADTVVCMDRSGGSALLAKPTDVDDARRMLRLLSGATHTVYTGVCLVRSAPEPPGFHILARVVDTQVTFREISEEMIEAYIATGEPFDKAGGYGIQGYARAFVEAIHGDYFNVVGLPIQTVGRMLEQIGIEWWRGPAALE